MSKEEPKLPFPRKLKPTSPPSVHELKGKTCWKTIRQFYCPQCQGLLTTNGKTYWCAHEGCDNATHYTQTTP